jgi:Uma2 family endonuclease
VSFWYPKTREAWKITVPAFHALEPFLAPDPRHELLDGVIYALPIPSWRHTVTLQRLDRQLLAQERPGLHVWRGGILLSPVSEPWPDLTLLPAEPGLDEQDNPGAAEVRLVVEVAAPEGGLGVQSSNAAAPPTSDFETGPKARAYHAAGVPEYWVVDVVGRRVSRHLLPDYAPQAFSEGPLSPQAYPGVGIDVGALFA